MDSIDREISEQGQNIGSVRLESPQASRVVRVRDGQTSAADGPFTENEEQLSGIYIIEAADLEEATGIAVKLPTATFFTI